VLVAYTIKKKEFAWREILRGSDTEWFCLCFALTYLALVTPRGIPGYLLIPPAFALWRAACGMMVRTSTTWIQLPRLWSVAVSSLFLLCASFSLTRYVRYARSINDSTLAFQLIQMTHSPRLVVSNATEASRNATAMAQAEGSPVTFVSIDDARDPQSALQNFKGDVVLIEFTQYFGKIPDDFLEACRSSVGEWTMTMDKGFYRIFYGVRR
jgi:hypothetical protein